MAQPVHALLVVSLPSKWYIHVHNHLDSQEHTEIDRHLVYMYLCFSPGSLHHHQNLIHSYMCNCDGVLSHLAAAQVLAAKVV